VVKIGNSNRQGGLGVPPERVISFRRIFLFSVQKWGQFIQAFSIKTSTCHVRNSTFHDVFEPVRDSPIFALIVVLFLK
jgi:hypothetical protein